MHWILRYSVMAIRMMLVDITIWHERKKNALKDEIYISKKE